MRTTLNIDDALLAEAKALAGRTGRTLTSVVEDALRQGLRQRAEPGGRLPVPVFTGDGVLPGVDLDNTAELLELMEAPDAAR